MKLDIKQQQTPQPETCQHMTNMPYPPNVLKCSKLEKGPNKDLQERSVRNELGRLSQG